LLLIVIAGLAVGGIYGWRKFAAHRRKTHPAPAPATALASTPATTLEFNLVNRVAKPV
jgi:hypothetical protein